MRAYEFTGLSSVSQVDEGWREVVGGLALGLGLSQPVDAQTVVVQPGDTLTSIARVQGVKVSDLARANKLQLGSVLRPRQQLKLPSVQGQSSVQTWPVSKPQAKSLASDQAEHVQRLVQAARRGGIKNPTELAALLAQAQHETGDFTSLEERGSLGYFKKMYDPRGNPSRAKRLGNTEKDDGYRYRGRGYLQITGRENYRRAGQALGPNFEQDPDLLADPRWAAEAAVWFWLERVRPRVRDFANVAQVTKPINPALRGLEDRQDAFDDFRKIMVALR